MKGKGEILLRSGRKGINQWSEWCIGCQPPDRVRVRCPKCRGRCDSVHGEAYWWYQCLVGGDPVLSTTTISWDGALTAPRSRAQYYWENLRQGSGGHFFLLGSWTRSRIDLWTKTLSLIPTKSEISISGSGVHAHCVDHLRPLLVP